MFKKSLLSLAVASSIALTGCLDSGGSSNNANPDYTIVNPTLKDREGRTWPLFDPVARQLPIPSDLMFDSTAGDGTFVVATDAPNPATEALNSISGASTIAPIDIVMSGSIDPETVDARAVLLNGATPIPNPNQTVFLIELEYASGDPVQGLSNREPPTIPLAIKFAQAAGGDMAAGAELVGLANSPAYRADVIQLDGQDVIRVSPLKPLNPRKRYVVALTNGITDASGKPLIQSLSYANLTKTDAEEPVGSSSLTPVRTLINNLWEPITAGYFQLTNSSRAALEQQALSADNIVMSYSFTTSGDEKVLEYIANPSEWFNDQLTNFIRVSAAKAAVAQATAAQTSATYDQVKTAADAAYNSFNVAALGNDALSTACGGFTAGAQQIGCAAQALAGSFAPLLPTPKAQPTTVTSRNIPANLTSAVVSSLIQSVNATRPPLVAQGTISVPYYMGIPTDADGSAIQNQAWVADDGLATAINSAFASVGLSLPQANTSKSTVVNYIFPFPKQSDADPTTDAKDNVEIPWLAVYPHPAAAAANGWTKPYPTVIYQHGITTDRSAVLSVGTILAQQGFAVIGIDQVAHGIAPISAEAKLSLAATLLAAGQENGLPAGLAPSDTNNQAVVDGTIALGFVMTSTGMDATTAQGIINNTLSTGSTGNAGLDAAGLNSAILALKSFENTVANSGGIIPGIAPTDNERHFNYTANASSQAVPMSYDEDSAFGSSGSLYINLLNFTNSRDKNRQGVIDLLNLRMTLSSIDLDGSGTADDMSNASVSFAGHSLGTVSGVPFVTVANSAPNIPNVNTASFLTPASGIVRMLENSPSFAPRIVGGLAAAGIQQGSASYETFMNVFQATLDSVDPINFGDNLSGRATGSFQTNADDTGVLLVEVAGTADENGATRYKSDQTNVIETASTQLTTQFGTALPAYLSGVEKLADQMNATNVLDATADGSPDVLLSRLAYGSHGMFVLPIVSAAEAAALGETEAALEETRRQLAFQEGVSETVGFFQNNGELLGTAVGSDGLVNAPAPFSPILIDDASYEARTNKQLN